MCVCGFVVRTEKTVFKRHRRRERKKSFLHLPSARCNGFTALQRSKPREASGCRCLQSRELRVQESFPDTIAFNQLFSGEIAGVIMEFKKIQKAGGRAGRQPIRQRGRGCRSEARAAQGKAFHIYGGKKRGKRGGEGECNCNRGWAFEVRPRIRSSETSTCKFHAERRAHK